MSPTSDDLGTAVPVPSTVRRVVSLVPSLTESVADTGLLVGATDWCSHPADLDVVRVRGTKNPDVARVIGLARVSAQSRTRDAPEAPRPNSR